MFDVEDPEMFEKRIKVAQASLARAELQLRFSSFVQATVCSYTCLF